jgi:hypothetical protein
LGGALGAWIYPCVRAGAQWGCGSGSSLTSTETKDISNNHDHPPSQKKERALVKENSRKERKIAKDIIHLQLLMDKQNLFVPFVEILDTLKTPAEPKKGQ